jgi:hypothetical protein
LATLLSAIPRYRDTLFRTGSDDARTMFEGMFDKYGTIHWA